jgi:hypothetical protein
MTTKALPRLPRWLALRPAFMPISRPDQDRAGEAAAAV